jgi:hypothetical protein
MLLQSQQIAYARFGTVNASHWPQGQPLDATDNCVDGGCNTAVYFEGLCVWDGGGADDNWSTPENWTRDTLPEESDAVLFNAAGGTSDCVLDADTEVFDFRVYASYEGTIRAGSSTLTVGGEIFNISNEAVGRFDPEAGAVLLSGAEQMRVQIPENQTFNVLTVSGGGAQFVHAFRADALTLQAGADVWFSGHDPAYPTDPPEVTRVGTFICAGTSESPVTLYPAIDHAEEGFRHIDFFANWHLVVTGSASVAHATVLNCDARAGAAIDGTDGCLDLGGNENWTFAPFADIRIPDASPVSPLCVEGWRQGDGSHSVTIASSAEAEKAATFAGDSLWYGDIALSASGDTTVTVEADGAPVTTGSTTWVATDLAGKNPDDHQYVLRPGEKLLLTAASAAGDTVEIDPYGTGSYTVVTEPTPAAYAATGIYTAAARVNGEAAGAVEVRVVDIDLDPNDPLAARVGSVRKKEIPVLGAEPEDVVFTAANPAELEIIPRKPEEPGTVAFRLYPWQRSAGCFLVARAGDARGPILRTQEIHTFTLEFCTKTRNPIFETYPDGDTLVGASLLMEPHYPDLKILIKMSSGGALFEETGSDELWVHTDGFDQNGQDNFYMLSSTTAIVCHFVSIVEDE